MPEIPFSTLLQCAMFVIKRQTTEVHTMRLLVNPFFRTPRAARPLRPIVQRRLSGQPMPTALPKCLIQLLGRDGLHALSSKALPMRHSMASASIRPTTGTTRARTKSFSSTTPRCPFHSSKTGLAIVQGKVGVEDVSSLLEGFESIAVEHFRPKITIISSSISSSHGVAEVGHTIAGEDLSWYAAFLQFPGLEFDDVEVLGYFGQRVQIHIDERGGKILHGGKALS